jgi:hypothetical protein
MGKIILLFFVYIGFLIIDTIQAWRDKIAYKKKKSNDR